MSHAYSYMYYLMTKYRQNNIVNSHYPIVDPEGDNTILWISHLISETFFV